MTTITINANNFSQEFCFPAKSEAVFQESISSPHSTEYSDNVEHEYSELTQEISTPELKDWSEKKDKVLKNLAAKCKYDWKKIAKKFNTNEKTEFTPLELKQKYKDLTKVAIPLRVKFSHQEDLQIAKYFETYGCDWAQISTFFTDRTPMMLKNRYYSHIRKRNLLSSMLDELKDDTESLSTQEEEEVAAPVTIQAQPEITETEDEDDDSFKFFFERSDGIFFRKFSANNFFVLENVIPNELFDRIAF